MSQKKAVTNNVTMLYIMNITQLVLPLVTLPYLARVLTLGTYGVVSYTKNVMIYVNLLIEFGYLLSGTKEVVDARGDSDKLGRVIGRTTQAKLFISLISFIVLLGMILSIKMLRMHPIFTILMAVPQFLSIFLFDYFFRGIEKMQIITIRFLIMRGIATVLTFFVVKNSQDMIYIPLLDILGGSVAVIWVFYELRKMGIHIQWVPFREVIESLKVSLTYFMSNIATTAFGAFNTIIVGMVLNAHQVAYWTMLMSLVVGVQGLYSPISDGIYPQMIKTRSLRLFRNILLIFTPVLIAGCLFTYFAAPIIVAIIGGHKYIPMYPLLKQAVPLLFVSFYSILCGWPLLGSINKIRETTMTTIVAASSQVIGVLLLLVTHTFSLYSLVWLRILSESIMLMMRLSVFARNKDEYNV